MLNKKLDLKKFLSLPLIRNALYLTLAFFTGIGSGLIFWILAARFYPVEDVGLASSLISLVMLVSTALGPMNTLLPIMVYLGI